MDLKAPFPGLRAPLRRRQAKSVIRVATDKQTKMGCSRFAESARWILRTSAAPRQAATVCFFGLAHRAGPITRETRFWGTLKHDELRFQSLAIWRVIRHASSRQRR